ncbi:MAG: hypothetical protein ACR2LT_08115 [Pyrinomonadaceae bacterium]
MGTKQKKASFDSASVKHRIERGRRGKWWRRAGGKASGFKYLDTNGKTISDEKFLERIKLLVIPPA